MSDAHTRRERPIFVVGAPRSGTTLLQYMLRSHPRICMPTGESHFIIPLYRNSESFGDLKQIANIRKVLTEMYRISPSFLDTDLHGLHFEIDALAEEFHVDQRASLPAIITGLFEKNARGEGKVRWGDKTPYYVLHLPKILEWFPDAQFIHMLRDGRDCALSLIARRHDFGIYNTYYAAKYWQQYVDVGQAVGRGLGSDVYFEMRYEDLVTDSKTALQRICGFLDEAFDEAIVNFKKSGEAGKTPLLQTGVQIDNAGKWRTTMQPLQLRVFESVASDTLARLGYPLETSGKKMPLPVRAVFRGHNLATGAFFRTFGKSQD